jgi:endonuclease/exonuclease/phosphatase family metal-dependent hydrolase
MFEAIFNRLSAEQVRPRILCGDFNSPKAEHPDGSVEFWGGSVAKALRERWQNAERSVILGLADHQLPDVFRSLHRYSLFPTSWIQQGARRRYDHVFASRLLHADSCIYHEEWLTRRLSDHAAVEATFDID